MKGQEHVIAMRKRGIKPGSVSLEISSRKPTDWHAWRETQGEADVVVGPTETPELLDLRFCVGTLVFVGGSDSAKVKRLVLAAEAAGAARVFGFATRWLPHDRTENLGTFCTVGDQSWRN